MKLLQKSVCVRGVKPNNIDASKALNKYFKHQSKQLKRKFKELAEQSAMATGVELDDLSDVSEGRSVSVPIRGNAFNKFKTRGIKRKFKRRKFMAECIEEFGHEHAMATKQCNMNPNLTMQNALKVDNFNPKFGGWAQYCAAKLIQDGAELVCENESLSADEKVEVLISGLVANVMSCESLIGWKYGHQMDGINECGIFIRGNDAIRNFVEPIKAGFEKAYKNHSMLPDFISVNKKLRFH